MTFARFTSARSYSGVLVNLPAYNAVGGVALVTAPAGAGPGLVVLGTEDDPTVKPRYNHPRYSDILTS
jgi:hypothetical protein